MKRYSLSYRPMNQDLEDHCIHFAREYFSWVADGYLLDPVRAKPHVNLCEFNAAEDNLLPLWHEAQLVCPTEIDLTLDLIYVQNGRGEHKNYVWVGLGIGRTPSLIKMQDNLVNLLAKHRTPSLTPSYEKYFPHLALARLSKTDAAEGIPVQWSEIYYQKPLHRFRLTIGLSDENGAYLSQVYPEPLPFGN